jgi:4-diphosphocytidyl-2-C-methyl-D-erythritol kinase
VTLEPMAGAIVRRRARAKLNVFLRVLSLRDDGYHDLESLVLPLTLADDVTAALSDRLHVAVVEVVDAADTADTSSAGSAVPAGGLNLALVAALALAESCAMSGGAEIRIEKRIPVAGGLGGGSADAAATISALNELWGCGLDRIALAEIGARIGSDVPAAIAPGAVVMSGRGERLEDVGVPELSWVIVPMPFGVRSPDAYRWWDEGERRTGPEATKALDAARAGDPARLGSLLFNDLEPPVFERHPEMADVKRRLLELGALGAVMSGSGSSIAGLASDARHAEALAARIDGAIAVSGPAADR